MTVKDLFACRSKNQEDCTNVTKTGQIIWLNEIW